MQGHNVRIGPTVRTVPDVPTDPPETEPRICATCYWFEPCPCNRCGWGVCNQYDSGRLPSHGYMAEDSDCGDWKEA